MTSAVELAAYTKPRPELSGLKGVSAQMQRLHALIEKSARASVPILVSGESGTGKELVARAIHDVSPRATKPFVVVDCGSLSPTLIGSELFGHERGAFTGAVDRHAGAFEQAGDGTVFLDEIGELPPASQAMLLGVLERGCFRRIGGSSDIALRARVVSATNRNLRSDVSRQSFRLDLYHRLAIIVLQTPALRERPEDIPMLLGHFARRAGYTGLLERLVPAETLERMMSYSWPGNVRELRNLVDAAVTLGEDGVFDHINALENPSVVWTVPDPLAHTNETGGIVSYNKARAAVITYFERSYLKQLYEHCHGNVSKAARLADMDRGHLADLLQRHAIHTRRSEDT